MLPSFLTLCTVRFSLLKNSTNHVKLMAFDRINNFLCRIGFITLWYLNKKSSTHRCYTVWPLLHSELHHRTMQTERSDTLYRPPPPQESPLHSHRSLSAEIRRRGKVKHLQSLHFQVTLTHFIKPSIYLFHSSHLPKVPTIERDPLDEVRDDIVSCRLPAHRDFTAWEICHPQVWWGGHLHWGKKVQYVRKKWDPSFLLHKKPWWVSVILHMP